MIKKFGFLFLFVSVLGFTVSAVGQNIGQLVFDPASFKGKEGFFRVGKTRQGQWWFITPDGQPFYYKGVCAVNRAGTMGGRRALPGPYAATVDRKYNYAQSPDAFVQSSLKTLRDHGFNALGAWATEEFFNRGMPFTEIIEFFKEGPFLPSTDQRQGLPDIFDPQWMINADRKVRALCSPLRESKDLVGYFTDNEIGFGKIEDGEFNPGFQGGQFDMSLLRLVLGMDSSKAAYKEAWKFVLSRHDNSFRKLSAAWKVSIPDAEEMKVLNTMKARILGDAYEEDAASFSKMYAERYFQIAQQLIRRYDPNHLIMGCRFGGPPPTYVLDAMKPYTDVVSANNYQPILYDRYDTVYKHTGLPLLIGEISWNTDPFKQLPFASETSRPLGVKERMFRAGSNTLQRTAMHDGIIGFTWYRWVSPASTGQDYHSGVVNLEDEPDMHSQIHKDLLPGLDLLRAQANGGAWKNIPVMNGEMNLFFDSLRTGRNHYIRLEWQDGKPLPHLAGWKMNGKPLSWKLNGKDLSMTLQVDFAETPQPQGTIPPGKGTYTIQLRRVSEKWQGTYSGMYEGKPFSGKVYAFYFPAYPMQY